jgi:predicted alpha/beta hydrolase family esterase
MTTPTVLLLPGWQGSGPGHWQMRWAAKHNYTVVEQDEWLRPRRGDWLARLDEVVINTPAGTGGANIVLAAHSLGCIQVAAWAAVSHHTARVRSALLVAPGDVEQAELREQIPGWAPIVRQHLPFAATLVGSSNDPFCAHDRARSLAADWGARWLSLGDAGHINADSGLGDWPEGHALLQELMGQTAA